MASDRDLAERAVRAGAAAAARVARGELEVRAKSSAADLVSAADHASEVGPGEIGLLGVDAMTRVAFLKRALALVALLRRRRRQSRHRGFPSAVGGLRPLRRR